MLIKPQARENARALVGAAALGSCVGLAIGGAYLAGGLARATLVHAQIQRLAGAASAGFSETALHAATGDGDAGVLAIARQHDPLAVPDPSGQDRQVAALMQRLQERRDARTSPPAPAAGHPPVVKVAVTHLKTVGAQPFHMRGALDQSRDLECLTQAVYYEARGEPEAGQKAVAQVILNRVRHPAFPKTICGVVFQGVATGGCQFSFACDGQTHHPTDNPAWRRAEAVAAKALDGQVMSEVGDATHFHVARTGQDWSSSLLKVAQIGAHVFYRFSGHAGSASMFRADAQPSGPASAPRPLFASLSLAGGAQTAQSAQAGHGPSPATFIASASAVVEHAASIVENAAKGVAPAKDTAAALPAGHAPSPAPTEEPAVVKTAPVSAITEKSAAPTS